jgi:hypothetical protein
MTGNTSGEAIMEAIGYLFMGLPIIVLVFFLIQAWNRIEDLADKLDLEKKANLELAIRAARYDEIRRRLRLKRKERGF